MNHRDFEPGAYVSRIGAVADGAVTTFDFRITSTTTNLSWARRSIEQTPGAIDQAHTVYPA